MIMDVVAYVAMGAILVAVYDFSAGRAWRGNWFNLVGTVGWAVGGVVGR